MAARTVLRHRGFRDLLIGQAVSSFGDWMGTVALMALVLDLTGSATAVGVILVLRLLPAGFAGPIAAGVAERWDRRRIMLACDVIRAALVALVPLVRAAWWVYLWAFLLEVANLVFLPARDASIPDLVEDEDELPAANGFVLGSSYGNIPIGAGAFALLTLVPISWNGYLDAHPNALALWLDAATYLVSFAFIRRLDVLGPASTGAVTGGPGQERRRRGLWAGVWSALNLPIVRAVLPATITAFVGVGALFSLGVVFVRQVLHASTGEFGGMVALFGVGGVAGWAWLQRQPNGGATLATIRFAVTLMGVILAIMSLLSNVLLAYALAVPFGAAGASALIASITYLQEMLTGEQRLLGLTVYHIVFRVGMSVAAIGGGLAATAFGPTRWPLLGTLEPSALVLLCAGAVMVCGALLMPTAVSVPRRRAAVLPGVAASAGVAACAGVEDGKGPTTVAIVTDSAATLPPELAAGNEVTVVPIEVTIDGRSNGDRQVPLDEVLTHLQAGVRTSSPSPGRFSSAIAAAQRGKGVLVLTIARSMSSTFQAASLAARRTDGPVEVLDTGTAAGGEGLVVLAAAQAARVGHTLDEVLAAARRAAAEVRLVATLDDLDHLVRGGRLPKAIGRLAGLLGVRPLFEFRDGAIRPLPPALSRRGARRRLLGRWRRTRPRDGGLLHVAALHALAEDEAEWLLGAVETEVEPATAFVGEFDAAMVAHTGPGLVGLAWWWEPGADAPQAGAAGAPRAGAGVAPRAGAR